MIAVWEAPVPTRVRESGGAGKTWVVHPHVGAGRGAYLSKRRQVERWATVRRRLNLRGLSRTEAIARLQSAGLVAGGLGAVVSMTLGSRGQRARDGWAVTAAG
jgi:hypothetical protein